MKKQSDLQPAPSSVFHCTVNGEDVQLRLPADKRLLAIIREDMELTGTKRSCEIGRCGACMVLIDGKPVNACLTMAYQCSGKAITTIEGLARPESLHPVQQAFLDEGGYQCGYCTPGMIISVTALLEDIPNPSEGEIEEALSGNLCRCTGYGGIVRAVKRAIDQRRERP
ncbi:(2Fe-2S)-binding protein [Paenibacillus sacheonensis]|uniref:2Fe-2S iron-sulfur cluster binding domain-containing protein n=1 Tax=Paenibacillus sacheonensis TaxID=742054 RepID=A0A7X4YMG8_9BACL|nr:(2Fe-2S)-binding protein [Paenibacillus sacheonensis]MBM7563303.1 carbon-monoxide dehydrogenase small subunit [Paenibacillus sacheonensis]NBC68139.1 2Fe-2S iron-sulfur cluster binding domain-containing protein [Paenibacillus sacheonensis]